ncbi:MAG TPA: CsgG/HfaB family protein [Vicinamibacterales bacterium]|nr:CsgG/HfaB family protein [Vicinamibacterales bacterium]
MKQICRFSALACVFTIALATQSFAQGKIKVAIWEFDNNAAHSYWYWDKMGPAARNIIDTAFSENKLLANKFSVIERDKLNLVLKEQGLAQTGAVDPATAAKVGKILGVKYIILGGIDKFDINNTKGAIGRFGVGGNLVQSNATVNLRVVDSTTAERVLSIAGDGQVKKGGGFVKDVSASRDAEWGIASETINEAAKAVVQKLTTGDYLARISDAAHPGGMVEGKIIKVEGNKAYINLGSSSGIKMGDKFNIVNVGEALIDPDTGAKLGASEKQTGNGSVVEVQDKFAVIQFTGTATAKDTIRKQ